MEISHTKGAAASFYLILFSSFSHHCSSLLTFSVVDLSLGRKGTTWGYPTCLFRLSQSELHNATRFD